MGGWTFVEFEPKRVVVLDCYSAREILRRGSESRSFTVLANLGLKEVNVEVEGSKALVEGLAVDLSELKVVAGDEEGVYSLSGRGLSKLVIAGEHFYRLRRVADNTAPTLEIDGIHMHRIEGTTPWEDAKRKVSLAKVRPGHRVLDTCMGLGYTAIHSVLAGAEVLTVEVDPNVVELASYNPWSWRLSDPRIKVVLGDVCDVVEDLGVEAFDRVIHDPPRFSPRTGDLYGKKLYSELYRILRDGGLLFHYVGSPGRARGLDLAKGVSKRLAEVGFDVKVLRGAEAVLAIKA